MSEPVRSPRSIARSAPYGPSPAASPDVRLGSLRIGTSGWHYASWRGLFYPEGLRAKDFLSYYITRFDTTELNNPFYRTPTEAAVEAWRDATPESFLFAWKLSRFITHMKRLSDVDESVPFALGPARRVVLRSPGSPSPAATASPPAGDDSGGSGSPGAAPTTVIPGEPKAREGDP